MKRIVALVALSTLLVVALLWVNQQRKQSPAYILAQYSQTPAVGTLTRCHLQNLMIFTDATKQVDVGNLIFFGTWFVDEKASLVMHDLVDGSGSTGISRIVSTDASVLQTENSTLTAAQMASLRASLRELPPSQTHPALSDLYILSFRDRNNYSYGNWTTRIYDKSRLPPAIVAIHKIAVPSKMAGTFIKGIAD